MIPAVWIDTALARIAPYLTETPLTFDPQHNIFLKWENRQRTGSFKLRGAINKVLSLQEWEQQRGLVAASAGNHGQGVALAGQIVGAPVVVFASQAAPFVKIEAMRSLGADVRLVPGSYGDAELAGIEYAHSQGATWVSPYNDGQVIAGQGTLAIEVLRQLEKMAPRSQDPLTWLVPVGGGGLCAGIACALAINQTDQAVPDRLVGVQSEASPFFYHILKFGDQSRAEELPSLADGLAGPVEQGSITIPIIQRYLHDIVLVSEAEIAQAVKYAWEHYHECIEGSGAVGLAAILSGNISSKPAVVIISGGNIQPELHRRLCAMDRI